MAAKEEEEKEEEETEKEENERGTPPKPLTQTHRKSALKWS